jgi:hypothetical protein
VEIVLEIELFSIFSDLAIQCPCNSLRCPVLVSWEHASRALAGAHLLARNARQAPRLRRFTR